MPTISQFYGIMIRMYFGDHGPPNFHPRYGNFEASIDIRSLEILRGTLPHRALSLMIEWARIHREEFSENWRLVEELRQPKGSTRCRKIIWRGFQIWSGM